MSGFCIKLQIQNFSVVLNYTCFHDNDRNLKLNLINKMHYECILAVSNLSFVPAES